MSSDNAIEITNLSKCYQIYAEPRDRLKQFVIPRVKRTLGKSSDQYFREFWALRDISFDVNKGETVGIVGRNGSGKSTLLQIICGTLSATSGTATTHGRIAALLELGSGFNPEFTGRENVYMNAAVLGLSTAEIDSRFDGIAAFADIGEFIERPVKTYSSGMMVRLAFAVQAQVDPDILIVDEALAVGDVRFQAKCFERLRQLKRGGTSILLVTHSTEQIVTHCDRALLLDGGRAIRWGDPKDIVHTYMDLLFGKERKKSKTPRTSTKEDRPARFAIGDSSRVSLTDDVFSSHNSYNPHEYRWGDGAARILDYCLLADEEAYPPAVNTGQHIDIVVSVHFEEDIVRPIFGLALKTKEGVTVYGVNSETIDLNEFKLRGAQGETVIVRASFECRLAPGDYFVSLGIATKQGEEVVPHDRRYDSIHIHVRPEDTFFGLIDLGLNLEVEETS
jgi:lipopolysaccharide transport system ATP-binding protein